MYHSARRKKRPTARIVINYGSPLYEPWRKECHDKKPNNTQYSYTLVKICKHLQIDFKAFKHAVQAFKYHCHKHVKTFVSVLKSGNFHEDEVCQAGREKVVKTIMTRWGKKKTVAAPTCTTVQSREPSPDPPQATSATLTNDDGFIITLRSIYVPFARALVASKLHHPTRVKTVMDLVDDQVLRLVALSRGTDHSVLSKKGNDVSAVTSAPTVNNTSVYRRVPDRAGLSTNKPDNAGDSIAPTVGGDKSAVAVSTPTVNQKAVSTSTVNQVSTPTVTKPPEDADDPHSSDCTILDTAGRLTYKCPACSYTLLPSCTWYEDAETSDPTIMCTSCDSHLMLDQDRQALVIDYEAFEDEQDMVTDFNLSGNEIYDFIQCEQPRGEHECPVDKYDPVTIAASASPVSVMSHCIIDVSLYH